MHVQDHNTLESIESRRYLVVTPCRNEEEYIGITIETMAAQSVLPSCWVIVDDGSTDRTPQILADASEKFPWIKVIQRADRGARAVGPGVIQAFNDGLAAVNIEDFDYICKLDGDLGLPQRYFEILMEHMEANPLMGNMSGKTYIPTESDRWVSERMGDENAIGASKFYRTACFRDIGGFVAQASWDGIDGHTCRMKGWIAGSLDLEEIRLKHYRPQGSSQQGVWTGRKRWGRGKYFMGSSLIYVLAVSCFRMMERPFVIGGLGILWGYLVAMVTRADRYENAEYIRFFRRYEFSSLIRGKRKTLAIANNHILQSARATNDPRLAHAPEPIAERKLVI